MIIPEETELLGLLGQISKRLSSIEGQMRELVRLEERVNGYSKALSRLGKKADDVELRMREIEKSQADINYCIKGCDMGKLKDRVTEIERTDDVEKGYVKLVKEIGKWLSIIVGGILVYKFTKG